MQILSNSGQVQEKGFNLSFITRTQFTQ